MLSRGETENCCLHVVDTIELSIQICRAVFAIRFLLHMYAHPFFFGLEFVPEDRQLQRVNTRLFQGAGRHILMWPRGAPTAAVQGRAAWLA